MNSNFAPRSARRLAAVFALTACMPAQADDFTSLSLEQLLDVSIVGASKYAQKQSQVAAAVSVITRQEIATYGWRTLAEALASLPGVYLTYDRQYHYVGTRGFGLPGDFNTRLLLTIDGNRVNDVVFDQAYIGRDFPLDLNLIERIEFIPGPGSAVYGHNAMLGVVNVVTRSVEGVELAAAAQSPQALRQARATWGRRFADGTELTLSASALRAGGEDRMVDFGSAGVSGVARGLDGERDRKLFGRISSGRFAFGVTYGDRRKDDPLGTYSSDPLVGGQYQRDRHLLAQLTYEDYAASDTLHLSGRLFAGDEHYTAPFRFDGAPTLQSGTSRWRGGEARALSTAWANHKLLLGAEYQANLRQNQSYTDYQNPANNVDVPGTGWRAGVYLQDEWTLAPDLSATAGLRLDRSSTTANALSPRVGVIWSASPRTTLKALYGRAHRAPNAFERDFTYEGQAPNPALEVEKVDTIELVADHRAGPELALRGSLYHASARKLVTLGTDPLSGSDQYQNGATLQTDGVELSATRTWDGGGQLRASVAYQRPRAGDSVPVPNSPRLLGKLNLSMPWTATGLHLGLELQYSSRRHSLDGTELDGYWLANLNLVAARWARGLDVSLGLYNLFDARYTQPGASNNWQNAIEQDGRSVRLRLVQRF